MSGLFNNSCILSTFERRIASIVLVGQFPRLIRITFGGKLYASKRSMELGNEHFFISISSVSETSKKIFPSQVRKVAKNFFVSHSRSHVFQYIINSDSHSTNTRLPISHLRIKGDKFSVINWFHSISLVSAKAQSSEKRQHFINNKPASALQRTVQWSYPLSIWNALHHRLLRQIVIIR